MAGRAAVTVVVLVAAAAGCAGPGGAGGPGSGWPSGSGSQVCDEPGLDRPGYANPIGALPSGATRVSGAGSTFVAPLMSVWAHRYAAERGTRVAYQPIGSGGGVAQALAGTVDFGASDTPMTDTEAARAQSRPVLHIPVTLGAVAVAYHVSGLGSGMRFDGEALGRIYSGQMRRWNDPLLRRLNPDRVLPDRAIVVVHRADASGTTAVWTDFLSRTSPSWVAVVGAGRSAGKQVVWPVGLAGKGNDGVGGMLAQVDGAIGYVELAYVLAQGLPYGQVLNRAGEFVQPCPATVTRAAAGIVYPADLRVGFTDGGDPDAYPITGTTYVLVLAERPDRAAAVALVGFLAWVLSSGQDLAASVGYAPLGAQLQRLAYDKLREITVGGVPVVPP